MMPSTSVFLCETSTAGKGRIHLALLPPSQPRMRAISYQYPLKLVAPAPLWAGSGASRTLVHTVYLLTYGGGLVAGDRTDLVVDLETHVRLLLLTQGTTKIFRSPSPRITSSQRLHVRIQPGAALCYLPDPAQPFRQSCFEQEQIYDILVSDDACGDDVVGAGGLCVLDWACSGRPATGEHWSCHRYSSRNEIYFVKAHDERRLILRDSLVLDEALSASDLAHRMHGLGVYGTLILHGSSFKKLADFFTDEFQALARIGGRDLDVHDDFSEDSSEQTLRAKRYARRNFETAAGVIWSTAAVRGCVLVKFGAPRLDQARRWLRMMLVEEGSIIETFGERALLCLK